jgi:Putative zinc-finger
VADERRPRAAHEPRPGDGDCPVTTGTPDRGHYRGSVTALPELDCVEVVELVTDYLEGALDPETAARVSAHLAECPGCEEYVRQIRETARSVGYLPVERLSEQARNDLLAAFRDFRRR